MTNFVIKLKRYAKALSRERSASIPASLFAFVDMFQMYKNLK